MTLQRVNYATSWTSSYTFISITSAYSYKVFRWLSCTVRLGHRNETITHMVLKLEYSGPTLSFKPILARNTVNWTIGDKCQRKLNENDFCLSVLIQTWDSLLYKVVVNNKSYSKYILHLHWRDYTPYVRFINYNVSVYQTYFNDKRWRTAGVWLNGIPMRCVL